MANYVIGIDGGGTKTRGVLFDIEGHQLKETLKGPSNIMANESLAIKNVNEALDELMDGITPKEVAMIQIGLAGGSRYPFKKDFVDQIIQTYQVCCANLTSDVEMALHAIDKKDHQSAILIVSGTGSAFMVDDVTETFMIGGYGHLLNDEGSAYHVVIEAFKQMIDASDRGEPESALTSHILRTIGAKDVEDIKAFVYGHDKADIARLSITLANLAIHGDEQAITLFESEGLYLANQLFKAYHRLKHKEDVVIAFKGGFIDQAPYVKQSLLNKIRQVIPHFTIHDAELDPIIGAYHMAMRHIGGIVK